MNISKPYHKIIVKEFHDIRKMIEETNILVDKLYYFTAVYGVINRIMNLESDPTLIFINQVLQNCHQAITLRLSQRINGNVSTDIPDNLIKECFVLLDELIAAFENQNKIQIWEILQRYSNLTYSMNGNGYYMYLRNKITFEVDKTVTNIN